MIPSPLTLIDTLVKLAAESATQQEHVDRRKTEMMPSRASESSIDNNRPFCEESRIFRSSELWRLNADAAQGLRSRSLSSVRLHKAPRTNITVFCVPVDRVLDDDDDDEQRDGGHRRRPAVPVRERRPEGGVQRDDDRGVRRERDGPEPAGGTAVADRATRGHPALYGREDRSDVRRGRRPGALL